MLVKEGCLFILKDNRTPMEMHMAYSVGRGFFSLSVMWQTK